MANPTISKRNFIELISGSEIALEDLAPGTDGHVVQTIGGVVSSALVTDSNIANNTIAPAKLTAGAANTVLQSNGTVTSAAQLTNAHIAAAAAIAYSKLALGTSIVNADIAAAAAIAYSKLALTGSIVNGDIAGAAQIAYSKLNLANSISTTDIVNGTIATEDLAANALSTGSNSGGPGSAKDTTSMSFVDVDAVNSKIEWVSGGGTIYVWVTAGATNLTSTGDRTQIGVRINGIDTAGTATRCPTAGFVMPVSMVALRPAAAAGSTNTVLGRFRNVDTTATTARIDGFLMLAMELKR